MVTTRDVWLVLRRGIAYSAEDLVRVAGGTAASVTARVRDLRKSEFGSHVVICQRSKADGVYRYQLVPKSLTVGG